MKTNEKLNKSNPALEGELGGRADRARARRAAVRNVRRAAERGICVPHPEHSDPAREGEMAARRDAADAANGTVTRWSRRLRKYVAYPVRSPVSVPAENLDPVEVVANEARSALEAIAGWASDEGPLVGKSPMDVSAFARQAIGKVNGAALVGVWRKV